MDKTVLGRLVTNQSIQLVDAFVSDAPTTSLSCIWDHISVNYKSNAWLKHKFIFNLNIIPRSTGNLWTWLTKAKHLRAVQTRFHAWKPSSIHWYFYSYNKLYVIYIHINVNYVVLNRCPSRFTVVNLQSLTQVKRTI